MVFLPLSFFTQVIPIFINLGAETVIDYCSIFQVLTAKEMELSATRWVFSGQSRVRLRECLYFSQSSTFRKAISTGDNTLDFCRIVSIGPATGAGTYLG